MIHKYPHLNGCPSAFSLEIATDLGAFQEELQGDTFMGYVDKMVGHYRAGRRKEGDEIYRFLTQLNIPVEKVNGSEDAPQTRRRITTLLNQVLQEVLEPQSHRVLQELERQNLGQY